jgi:hypothetical protein
MAGRKREQKAGCGKGLTPKDPIERLSPLWRRAIPFFSRMSYVFHFFFSSRYLLKGIEVVLYLVSTGFFFWVLQLWWATLDSLFPFCSTTGEKQRESLKVKQI